MAGNTYLDALQMLARRELSEAQLRQRLTRRGHSLSSIDDAIGRLIAERSLDDTRVAGAIARSETTLRKRGRLRVLRQIQAAGIAPDIAESAVAQAFEEIDADALLVSALEKRLPAGRMIADQREFGRLYRYLVGQGFDADRVLALLRARSTRL